MEQKWNRGRDRGPGQCGVRRIEDCGRSGSQGRAIGADGQGGAGRADDHQGRSEGAKDHQGEAGRAGDHFTGVDRTRDPHRGAHGAEDHLNGADKTAITTAEQMELKRVKRRSLWSCQCRQNVS